MSDTTSNDEAAVLRSAIEIFLKKQSPYIGILFNAITAERDRYRKALEEIMERHPDHSHRIAEGALKNE